MCLFSLVRALVSLFTRFGPIQNHGLTQFAWALVNHFGCALPYPGNRNFMDCLCSVSSSTEEACRRKTPKP